MCWVGKVYLTGAPLLKHGPTEGDLSSLRLFDLVLEAIERRLGHSECRFRTTFSADLQPSFLTSHWQTRKILTCINHPCIFDVSGTVRTGRKQYSFLVPLFLFFEPMAACACGVVLFSKTTDIIGERDLTSPLLTPVSRAIAEDDFLFRVFMVVVLRE